MSATPGHNQSPTTLDDLECGNCLSFGGVPWEKAGLDRGMTVAEVQRRFAIAQRVIDSFACAEIQGKPDVSMRYLLNGDDQ